MGRIDYFDDPAAPAVNSVVPSVTVAVRDDRGRLLLIHKVDNGFWALPGGGHDPGESIVDTAVREVREETGVQVRITGLVGTYTDPRHVMQYDDGEVRQQFSLCFRAVVADSPEAPRPDGTETKAASWVEPQEIDSLNIHPSMRLRIDHALDDARTEPYLG
ncbi:NUDIX hydrolase [Pseudonocardia bannensis]|uniref:NUDIX domain-containing protein n=1 Tax=Pseudonocardia bannensis TaxID=630973 RepID=A0A848DP05_9PSEU|nr:NUDIX domain-containing protein [Pseudonocardia bannensis]NMH94560.1 NUDIX domain-containing protein [Pseudonocardia bannensis]